MSQFLWSIESSSTNVSISWRLKTDGDALEDVAHANLLLLAGVGGAKLPIDDGVPHCGASVRVSSRLFVTEAVLEPPP